VTANAYFLPTKRRIKDTFISSENAPKLTYSNLGAKKFSGVNPRTPNKGRGRGEGRGGEGEGGGEGVGEEGGREGEMFQPPNLLATRRLCPLGTQCYQKIGLRLRKIRNLANLYAM
jgi:hypothetical protein